MSASSAVAPSATQPTARKSAAATVTEVDASAAPVSYSSRQAKAYKAEDLATFNVPDLTMKDLLSAIPKHCFERSTFKSFVHLSGDLVLVAALGFAASKIDVGVDALGLTNPLAVSAAKWFAWANYWWWQGLVMTGIWIVAHECGHQAFSPSKRINNTVGWVLHSALLVPYHSWRISHASHHSGTGHLTRDEVFVPKTRSQKGLKPLKPVEDVTATVDAQDASSVEDSLRAPSAGAAAPEETWGEWFAELCEDAPAYALIHIVVQQLLGWPLYLINNSSGQAHYPKNTNHFHPESIIFDKRHRMQIIVSDIGLAITAAAIAFAAHTTSAGTVWKYYGIPYFLVNHWLVMITFLQHTDPMLPHYTADEWTFPRGALCTIDRKWLGPIGPYLLHGISETHVAHHISSKIPHYNAWEATEALKLRLGEHYHSTDENVFVSLWKSVRKCRFVDEADKVCFYRDAHGVPSRVAKLTREGESDSGLALSE